MTERSSFRLPASTPLRPASTGGRARGVGRWGRGMACLACLALLPLLGSPRLQARVSVVTLPNRDSVQLTIYNSEDLTLVKETRLLTFRRGMNRLEFSWANTLIDPTSVEFRALTHADQVDVLDVSFPPLVTNTLEWRINSEFAGEVRVEIRYFTSGINWSADYVAEAVRTENQMKFAGAVRVNNRSGEDYDNAEVRLVVGVIRLVEKVADLAQAGRPGGGLPRPEPLGRANGRVVNERLALAAMAMDGAPARKAEVAKESLGEYFLYTVGGRHTIPNEWSKRLPSFETEGVPITSYYKYEKERWGDNVIRFYRFKNDKASELGKEPLPDGSVKAFRVVSDDGLYSYVGGTAVKYIPIDEEVELELGPDQEVMIEPALMSWQKDDLQFNANGDVSGWTIVEQWQVELQNSKGIDVMVDLRRNFSGDWTLESADGHEKVDATKVKFVVPLKAGEKRKLTYTVTSRFGVNVRR